MIVSAIHSPAARPSCVISGGSVPGGVTPRRMTHVSHSVRPSANSRGVRS